MRRNWTGWIAGGVAGIGLAQGIAAAQGPLFRPADPWNGACRIERLDAPGRSMQHIPFPFEQKLGNCYAEAGATLYTAALGKKGWRASPLCASVLTSWDAKYREFSRRSSVSSELSPVDAGEEIRAYQLLVKLGGCPFHEIEGRLEAAVDSHRKNGKPDERAAEASEMYRSAVNLVFLAGQKASDLARKSGGLTAARADQVVSGLMAEWRRRHLPASLAPSRDRMARLLIEESKGSSGLDFLFRFIYESCSQVSAPDSVRLEHAIKLLRKPKNRASQGSAYRERAMVPADWDRIIERFRSAGAKQLPMMVSICAGGFDDPAKDFLDDRGFCSDHSGHSVVLKGAADCGNGKRWYLLQNSWGKAWCPDPGKSGKNPDIVCDRRSDGRDTGSVWVSQGFMMRTAFELDVVGELEPFLPKSSGAGGRSDGTRKGTAGAAAQ